jgi:hypothetical protein
MIKPANLGGGGDPTGHEKLTTATAIGFTAALITSGAKKARYVLISVETADIRFTLDGTTPVITATDGGVGHLLTAGQSYYVEGIPSVEQFLCINAVAASGAIVRCTPFF